MLHVVKMAVFIKVQAVLILNSPYCIFVSQNWQAVCSSCKKIIPSLTSSVEVIKATCEDEMLQSRRSYTPVFMRVFRADARFASYVNLKEIRSVSLKTFSFTSDTSESQKINTASGFAGVTHSGMSDSLIDAGEAEKYEIMSCRVRAKLATLWAVHQIQIIRVPWSTSD